VEQSLCIIIVGDDDDVQRYQHVELMNKVQHAKELHF